EIDETCTIFPYVPLFLVDNPPCYLPPYRYWPVMLLQLDSSCCLCHHTVSS
ncbi:unnamed protein product, partial [Brassica rapa subsp. trilocularis]